MNDQMIQLGGLWETTTKKGEQMLSGNLGRSARLVILPNRFKRDNPKAPDWNVYVAQRTTEPDGRSGKAPSGAASDEPYMETDIEF